MLSMSHNFLFVHIPKTAGNSIQNALRHYSMDKVVCLTNYQDGVERFEVRSELYKTHKHSVLNDYINEYGDALYSKLRKFTCVRNPWERAISYYFSPHRGKIEWNKRDFIKFVNNMRSVAYYLSIGTTEQEPLIEAVKNIDYIIRFENLNEDFEKVCGNIGIPHVELVVRNKSSRDVYYKYYDQETIDIVYELFCDEIEYFGYFFEEG